MNSPQQKPDKPLTPRQAWQPLTPRGVAAFAHAKFARLVVVQFTVAGIVALAVLWFLRVAWFPVVTEAAQQLPETGAIRGGELDYGGPTPIRLAENSRLAFIIDLSSAGTAGRSADIEVTFEKNRVVICGLPGCWRRPYEKNYIIGFNKAEVEPAWGAWRGPINAMTGVGTVLLLLLAWWTLALLCLPLAKGFAFFADRTITWNGAWRLNAAALLPGGLIMAAAILLYGFGTIDLFQFALLFLLHGVAGLLFVITSPFFLPAVAGQKTRKNPFETAHRAGSTSPFSQRRPD